MHVWVNPPKTIALAADHRPARLKDRDLDHERVDQTLKTTCLNR